MIDIRESFIEILKHKVKNLKGKVIQNIYETNCINENKPYYRFCYNTTITLNEKKYQYIYSINRIDYLFSIEDITIYSFDSHLIQSNDYYLSNMSCNKNNKKTFDDFEYCDKCYKNE